jgi:archaellum biogenesis ATPase FlaH
MYNFDNGGHVIVVGQTQNGKTYTVNHLLLKQKRGVLFFNTQLEDLTGYVKVNSKTAFSVIKKLLKKGYKVNYVPSSRLTIQSQEVSFIINQLFQNGEFTKKNFIYIVIDEVHLFKKQALEEVCRIATGGLRFGLHGIFLSQRPANMDNTLMTQSTNVLVFKCNMESQYFKNYDIPIIEILELIEKNGKYSFCSYDFEKIVDYKKI